VFQVSNVFQGGQKGVSREIDGKFFCWCVKNVSMVLPENFKVVTKQFFRKFQGFSWKNLGVFRGRFKVVSKKYQ